MEINPQTHTINVFNNSFLQTAILIKHIMVLVSDNNPRDKQQEQDVPQDLVKQPDHLVVQLFLSLDLIQSVFAHRVHFYQVCVTENRKYVRKNDFTLSTLKDCPVSPGPF